MDDNFTFDELTVGNSLKKFYGDNYFGTEALEDSWNWVRMGPLRIPFPNLKWRKEAIYLHDIMHLVTGYDTSWIGEGEVAAYELASGFPKRYWIGYIYPPITFTIGMLIAPRRT